MGEGGGERAASSAYAGLSLARQPAIWIGCSGALGSAGFAALRVAEIIACARGSERFPCALGSSRWGRPSAGIVRARAEGCCRALSGKRSSARAACFPACRRPGVFLLGAMSPLAPVGSCRKPERLRLFQLAVCLLWDTLAGACENVCARPPAAPPTAHLQPRPP